MNNKIYLDSNSFILKNFYVKEKNFTLDKDSTYNISIPNNAEFTNHIYISEKKL